MLVQKDNVHEVEQLLELAAEMKFTRLTYSVAIGDWSKDNWTEINGQKEFPNLSFFYSYHSNVIAMHS